MSSAVYICENCGYRLQCDRKANFVSNLRGLLGGLRQSMLGKLEPVPLDQCLVLLHNNRLLVNVN